jgi:hypothetical protein
MSSAVTRKRPRRTAGPRGDRRRARRGIKEGRQGADRQRRLPGAICARSATRTNAHSRSTPSSPTRRGLTVRAAHQCESNVIAGCAALSRFAAGRGPLPPHQGDSCARGPIFHSSDAAIRGHVFCSFLALSMKNHLDDLAPANRRRDARAAPLAADRDRAAAAFIPG